MMRRTLTPAIFFFILICNAISCTSAFPNDELDYMWRLDRIQYLSGYDFEGNTADEVHKEDVWFSFARSVIEIRDHVPYGYAGIAILNSNKLTIDYSMYEGTEDYDFEHICTTLRNNGIYSTVTEFNIECLTSDQLILSDGNCRLYFTRL